jgi:hypothetical protein
MLRRYIGLVLVGGALILSTAGACGADPCATLPPPNAERIKIVQEGDEVERTLQTSGIECEVVPMDEGGWMWMREHD